MQQLRNIADLQWVHGVRVMPDVHLGKGATVGSVIAMRDAVAPAAVGVDIGCGMESAKTVRRGPAGRDLSGWSARSKPLCPWGSRHISPRSTCGSWRSTPPAYGPATTPGSFTSPHSDVQKLEGKAHNQIVVSAAATTSSKCLDESQKVWILLHSGSRNIGMNRRAAHAHRSWSPAQRRAAGP